MRQTNKQPSDAGAWYAVHAAFASLHPPAPHKHLALRSTHCAHPECDKSTMTHRCCTCRHDHALNCPTTTRGLMAGGASATDTGRDQAANALGAKITDTCRHRDLPKANTRVVQTCAQAILTAHHPGDHLWCCRHGQIVKGGLCYIYASFGRC